MYWAGPQQQGGGGLVYRQALTQGATRKVVWHYTHNVGANLALGGESILVAPYSYQFGGGPAVVRISKSGEELSRSERGISRVRYLSADAAGALAASSLQDETGLIDPTVEIFFVDARSKVTSMGRYEYGVSGVALTERAMFWIAYDTDDHASLHMACRQ